MGTAKPEKVSSKAYFGCGGIALLGLFFWAVLSCCLMLTTIGLSTELGSGDTDLTTAYYAFAEIFTGSFAFCLSMLAIVLIFGSFGFYRQFHKARSQNSSYELNTVVLFFLLFVGGMLLGAALPSLALAIPGILPWIKMAGVLLGVAYFLYGCLMLWLLVHVYENYSHEGIL